ncbi:aldehyde dehydrogenase family protein [Nocardia sp. NPDC088792]|uniref:aldehyde dehydrogenase family protein n=1 Tax=Nocardia sp. NPDC088792 TaxID=3364332 RepID=UPI003803E19E
MGFSLLGYRDELKIGAGRLYIDGEWTDSAGEDRWEHVHPATGEVITSIANGTAEDADRAVRAARRAFDEGPWPRMKARERARVLRTIGDRLRAASPRMSRIQVLDTGTPLRFTSAFRASAEFAADLFDYHAGWIDKLSGETVPQFTERNTLQYLTFREPIGVVAAIVPWNAPVLQLANKLAPALAAGCTVVVKPSEYASLAVLEFVELLADLDLPPGVVNVVTGVGAAAGAALASHPGVNKVSFTGSQGVGKSILEASGAGIKRVTLELGGKSPALVFPDADARAAGRAVMSMIAMGLTGQQCTAQTRALVHADVYDEFLAGTREIAAEVRFGDPFDEATTSAPMINKAQLEKVLHYIELGKQEARAELLFGGDRPGGELSDGNWVGPAVFTGLDPHGPVAREEIFGPVLAVFPFTTEADAIRQANDSEYGLAAGIYTHDLTRALRVSRLLHTGAVGVNGYSFMPNAPIGGVKASGLGREGSRTALEAYTELKTVMIDLGE